MTKDSKRIQRINLKENNVGNFVIKLDTSVLFFQTALVIYLLRILI